MHTPCKPPTVPQNIWQRLTVTAEWLSKTSKTPSAWRPPGPFPSSAHLCVFSVCPVSAPVAFVLSGLHLAHRRGLTHRSVPGNDVLVGSNDVLVGSK